MPASAKSSCECRERRFRIDHPEPLLLSTVCHPQIKFDRVSQRCSHALLFTASPANRGFSHERDKQPGGIRPTHDLQQRIYPLSRSMIPVPMMSTNSRQARMTGLLERDRIDVEMRALRKRPIQVVREVSSKWLLRMKAVSRPFSAKRPASPAEGDSVRTPPPRHWLLGHAIRQSHFPISRERFRERAIGNRFRENCRLWARGERLHSPCLVAGSHWGRPKVRLSAVPSVTLRFRSTLVHFPGRVAEGTRRACLQCARRACPGCARCTLACQASWCPTGSCR